ncbi:MAG: hypothetical protein C4309_13145 [Chloroflexota bacterium]
MTTADTSRQKKCPYCTELLGFGKVHICPIGCRYVGVGEKALVVTCPYCGNAFETGRGHICLELIKLTEPAQ